MPIIANPPLSCKSTQILFSLVVCDAHGPNYPHRCSEWSYGSDEFVLGFEKKEFEYLTPVHCGQSTGHTVWFSEAVGRGVNSTIFPYRGWLPDTAIAFALVDAVQIIAHVLYKAAVRSCSTCDWVVFGLASGNVPLVAHHGCKQWLSGRCIALHQWL